MGETWADDGVVSNAIVPEDVTRGEAVESLLATRLDNVLVAVVITTLNDTALPSSATDNMSGFVLWKSGRGTNLVHQRAIRRPRSMNRCLRMKSTTRIKNMNAESITIRSSQSVFSRAVIRCLDVIMSVLSVSWVCDVARNVEVDSSTELGEFPCPKKSKSQDTHLTFEW